MEYLRPCFLVGELFFLLNSPSCSTDKLIIFEEEEKKKFYHNENVCNPMRVKCCVTF